MRTKFITLLCALGISLGTVTPSFAGNGSSPEAVVADVAVARPACLVATVAGAAVFIVALPFAAISKSTKKTANTLIVKPGKATFTRPVGDFGGLGDY